MKYIVGLDGGGTKTRCVIADNSGRPVTEFSGGPSNFLSIGDEKAASNILSIIKSGLAKIDSSIEDVSVILAGVSGAGRKLHADRLRNSLLSKLPENFTHIFVESDGRVALEGALAGGTGAILIAGTGSVIYGKDSSGRIHRAGGFGRIIGDEGSGYSIGVKTLRLVSHMLDGREKAGEMLESFSTIFHINNADDLITLVHNPGFDVASIAMFALRAADEGITQAKKILDAESDELIRQIYVMKEKTGLSPLTLVLIGSLIENDNYYSQLLIKKIKGIEGLETAERKFSPEMGAVIMAGKILTAEENSL